MPIKIFSGVLKELGPSVQEATERVTSAQYAYIEFTDGQMLRNVSVVGGLGGKLDAALDDQGRIELHVMQGGKKSDLLTAVQTSDGKLFAADLGGGSALGYIMVAGYTVLGLGLLPLFGVGLLFLWVAWRTWHGLHLVAVARQHVQGLPKAILV